MAAAPASSLARSTGGCGWLGSDRRQIRPATIDSSAAPRSQASSGAPRCSSTLVAHAVARHMPDAVIALTGRPCSCWSVPLMVLGLLLAHELGAFPLAFFSGYRLERRYGLSRQSLGGLAARSPESGRRRPVAGLRRRLHRLSLDALVCGLVVAGWRARACAVLVTCLATSRPCCCCPCSSGSRRWTRPSLVERLERLASRAGHARRGRLRVGAGDKTGEGECGAGRIGRDAAHPRLRHHAG